MELKRKMKEDNEWRRLKPDNSFHPEQRGKRNTDTAEPLEPET